MLCSGEKSNPHKLPLQRESSISTDKFSSEKWKTYLPGSTSKVILRGAHDGMRPAALANSIDINIITSRLARLARSYAYYPSDLYLSISGGAGLPTEIDTSL